MHYLLPEDQRDIKELKTFNLTALLKESPAFRSILCNDIDRIGGLVAYTRSLTLIGQPTYSANFTLECLNS